MARGRTCSSTMRVCVCVCVCVCGCAYESARSPPSSFSLPYKTSLDSNRGYGANTRRSGVGTCIHFSAPYNGAHALRDLGHRPRGSNYTAPEDPLRGSYTSGGGGRARAGKVPGEIESAEVRRDSISSRSLKGAGGARRRREIAGETSIDEVFSPTPSLIDDVYSSTGRLIDREEIRDPSAAR